MFLPKGASKISPAYESLLNDNTILTIVSLRISGQIRSTSVGILAIVPATAPVLIATTPATAVVATYVHIRENQINAGYKFALIE